MWSWRRWLTLGLDGSVPLILGGLTSLSFDTKFTIAFLERQVGTHGAGVLGFKSWVHHEPNDLVIPEYFPRHEAMGASAAWHCSRAWRLVVYTFPLHKFASFRFSSPRQIPCTFLTFRPTLPSLLLSSSPTSLSLTRPPYSRTALSHHRGELSWFSFHYLACGVEEHLNSASLQRLSTNKRFGHKTSSLA